MEAAMRQRRDSIVSIRITDDELGRLRAKATARGITVSDMLRRAVLADAPRQTVVPQSTIPWPVTRTSGHAVVIGHPCIQGGSTGIIWTGLPLGAHVNGSTITLSGDRP